jgi:hypothetical protein
LLFYSKMALMIAEKQDQGRAFSQLPLSDFGKLRWCLVVGARRGAMRLWVSFSGSVSEAVRRSDFTELTATRPAEEKILGSGSRSIKAAIS